MRQSRVGLLQPASGAGVRVATPQRQPFYTICVPKRTWKLRTRRGLVAFRLYACKVHRPVCGAKVFPGGEVVGAFPAHEEVARVAGAEGMVTQNDAPPLAADHTQPARALAAVANYELV